MARAMAAVRQGRTEGGNRTCVRDPLPPTMNHDDRMWVQRIKSALMDNRFRLQKQPIASLSGQTSDTYDLLVRLQDDDGSDVLPSEFLAAAQRHDLLRALDRWVLGASIALASQRSGKAFFVRISADTLNDRTIVAWLKNQLAGAGIEASRIVIQVPEADVDRAPDAAVALRHGLHAAGIRLALEHVGFGQDSLHLLSTLKPDFVKIDGKLMQGLAQHPEQQATVKALVEQARTVGAGTIAERVEDSNTMAVLFALGVESIQGRFVQKSEAVVLG
jgi:EAL domain-containing protein (putative c-di-GMP-specific phosphodiesterase class I)